MLLAFVLLAWRFAAARADTAAGAPLPILSVRLAPPAKPLPQVAAEIVTLEGQRLESEASQMRQLESAAQDAARAFKGQVDAVIARTLRPLRKTSGAALPASLLSVAEAPSSPSVAAVVLAVFPQKEPDARLKERIDRVEQTRSADESNLFEQARREVRDLGEIVLRELEEQLRRRVREADSNAQSAPVAFLQASNSVDRALPPELSVRLGASAEPFPTVGGLVASMEGRRDADEELTKQQVLTVQTQFLRAANSLVRDACEAAVRQLQSGVS